MNFLLVKAQRDNFLSDPLRGPAWARLRPGRTIPHVGGQFVVLATILMVLASHSASFASSGAKRAGGVVTLFECGQVRPSLRFSGRALTASPAAIAWRRWVRICAAERLVWNGTKRFRTAEKIDTKCCNEPTDRKPGAFAPVFSTEVRILRPADRRLCGGDLNRMCLSVLYE
uniref:Uncharacterized protein n=1 Tax=Rhizobium leguminosarum TaxID=384 RepID=A0A179BX59_RHILE|nr:hypothetical protein A4U53_38450 [Rhizobium leguminosarum]